jgi:hypothetical protein
VAQFAQSRRKMLHGGVSLQLTHAYLKNAGRASDGEASLRPGPVGRPTCRAFFSHFQPHIFRAMERVAARLQWTSATASTAMAQAWRDRTPRVRALLHAVNHSGT